MTGGGGGALSIACSKCLHLGLPCLVLLVHEYAVPVATQGYEAYRAETETWGDSKRAAEATADALTSEVADLKATMAAMEVCDN